MTIESWSSVKQRARSEYESLKHEYLEGRYRVYGTKRVEARLQKLVGEVIGHEAALHYLYKLQGEGEEE